MELFNIDDSAEAITADIAFQLSTYGYQVVANGGTIEVLNHDEHYMDICSRIVTDLLHPFAKDF